MRHYQNHKSSLFLIELIIAVVFFSLASAICLPLFVKSHLLNQETEELNCAINLAVSAAEAVKQSDGSFESLHDVLPELQILDDTTLAAYYDQNFETCDRKSSSYLMKIVLDTSEHTCSAQIEIIRSKDNKKLYTLSVQTHLPNRYQEGEM